MTKEEYKKYMRNALNTTKMISTEAVGYGVAGKLASSVDVATGNTMASKSFGIGSSLAGMPSMVYSINEVEKAVDNMFIKKKK